METVAHSATDFGLAGVDTREVYETRKSSVAMNLAQLGAGVDKYLRRPIKTGPRSRRHRHSDFGGAWWLPPRMRAFNAVSWEIRRTQ
jgi:hypothetical protein